MEAILADGEAEFWPESPAGPAVLLSARSAAGRGLDLLDGTGPESLHWAKAGTGIPLDAPVESFRPLPGRALPPVEAPPVKRPKSSRREPKPGYDDFVESDESPQPRILLGIGIPVWSPRLESGKAPYTVDRG